MIDRIRLSSGAKSQLMTLKRRTGMEHNNALCRHALCLSLANPAPIPHEALNFSGGIEIEWRVFTGNHETVYYNLIVMRLLSENKKISDISVKEAVIQHTHRGLSYLTNQGNDLLNFNLS